MDDFDEIDIKIEPLVQDEDSGNVSMTEKEPTSKKLPPMRPIASNSEAKPAPKLRPILPKATIEFVDVANGPVQTVTNLPAQTVQTVSSGSSAPKEMKDAIHPSELKDGPPRTIWMSNGKVRKYIPKESVAILKKWLYEHIYQPYPSDEEKLTLATQTNLTEEQVKSVKLLNRREIF